LLTRSRSVERSLQRARQIQATITATTRRAIEPPIAPAMSATSEAGAAALDTAVTGVPEDVACNVLVSTVVADAIGTVNEAVDTMVAVADVDAAVVDAAVVGCFKSAHSGGDERWLQAPQFCGALAQFEKQLAPSMLRDKKQPSQIQILDHDHSPAKN